ncbi:hypothetical protein GBA52_024109 [Prunus armeniaca]|nr:hypothetical protein GBA52_024109 [Prunus armeniaca]
MFTLRSEHSNTNPLQGLPHFLARKNVLSLIERNDTLSLINKSSKVFMRVMLVTAAKLNLRIPPQNVMRMAFKGLIRSQSERESRSGCIDTGSYHSKLGGGMKDGEESATTQKDKKD